MEVDTYPSKMIEQEQSQSDLLSQRPVISTLLDENLIDSWLPALVQLKNEVIGSNNEKNVLVYCGLVPRLLKWLDDEYGGPDFQTEVAVILGSLAMGSSTSIENLLEHKTVPTVLKSLKIVNKQYIEGLARCLKFVLKCHPEHCCYMYEENRFGSTYIPHLLSLLPLSLKCQELIISILELGCQSKQHQHIMLQSGAIKILAPMLAKPYEIQMPALSCFGKICIKNVTACEAIVQEPGVKDSLVDLMARDKPSEMQIEAAKVLTYLHRGEGILASDPVICNKTLGTLVRMCKRDRPLLQNVLAAETLAFLIERDVKLQEIASITDHLIHTLASFLQFKYVKKVSTTNNQEVDWGSEMKRAAFLAFASLAANDEDIREKIIQQDCFIEQVENSLNTENELEAIASLKCIHSLTRSVQQIRTVLKDSSVWKPILDMFSSISVEVIEKQGAFQSQNREKLLLAIGCICNLSLEFSPSRDAMLQNNTVEILCELCKSPDAALRFNAAWCLMSLAYGASDPLRENLIQYLSPSVIVNCLQDQVATIREKALGIVRNLLTNKQNIDQTIKLIGSDVVDAIFNNIRNPQNPPEVIQQALCVISNMADGPSCKAHIINKVEDITAVLHYLNCGTEMLQIPAIQFISNLVDNSDDEYGSFPRAGSYQRMLTLKGMGVLQMLESLIGTSTQEVEKRAHFTLKSFS